MADAPPKDKAAARDKKAAKEAKRERRAAAAASRPRQETPAAAPAPQAAAPPTQPRRRPQDSQPGAASLDDDLSNVGVLGDASLFGNVALPRQLHANTQAWCSAVHRGTIHPSVLSLCLRLSTMSVRGANSRAIAVLSALADVIRDYRTPPGAVLSRDLLTRVSQQVGHIVEARSMNTSTGHAVRFLKYEISVVDAALSEDEGKEYLLERIDHFIRDRIVYAARVIQTHAAHKIHDGDVVMTFAHSSIVEGTLLAARAQGRRFEAVVIDSRPLYEGRALAERLLAAGIPTTYALLSALSTVIPHVSLTLLGASSLFSNGATYARSGTATCAMMAHKFHVPVIVCCETYKFSDRIQLDSFVVNEAGNPADLLAKDPAADAGGLVTRDETSAQSRLKVVQLLFDVTPPRYISAIASEVGLSATESVGVILRDYKSVLFGI